MPPLTAAALEYGQKMEPIARREYVQFMKGRGAPVIVSLRGLCVSDNNPWLAASPDGLVVDISSSQKFWALGD